MGLFSRKKDEITVPSNALNIAALNIDRLYLETDDGFITKETYVPEKIKEVKNLVYGIGDTFYERYKINDIKFAALDPLFDETDPRVENWKYSLRSDIEMQWFSLLVFDLSNDKYEDRRIQICVFDYDNIENIMQEIMINSFDMDVFKEKIENRYCALCLANLINKNDENTQYILKAWKDSKDETIMSQKQYERRAIAEAERFAAEQRQFERDINEERKKDEQEIAELERKYHHYRSMAETFDKGTSRANWDNEQADLILAKIAAKRR